MALCQYDAIQPQQLKLLEPDGKESVVSFSFSLQPREQVLFLNKNELLTLDIFSLKYYNKASGFTTQLDIENAGLTESGQAFVAIRADKDSAEIYLENGTLKRIPLKYEDSTGYTTKFTVSARSDQRVLLTNYFRAVWYDGNIIQTTFSLDEERYRSDVFPHAWDMTRFYLEPTVTYDGTLILSTTGPSGMAIIGLRWNP